MPIQRLAFILIVVIIAAGLTVWLASMLGAYSELNASWGAIVPIVICVIVAVRLITAHKKPSNDDH
jgi:cytochrome c oxidase subunit IV